MSKLSQNPIFQRLTVHNQPVSVIRFAVIAALISVAMIGLSWWLAESGRLVGNWQEVSLIAGPVSALLLLLMTTTGAVLTVRASRGEAFQLIRMTDFPAERVVWAYVGATLHRTRLYWWLFVWVFPLSLLPLFLDVYDYANRMRSDSTALLTTPTRAHPMQVEMVMFWVISVIAGMGFSLLSISGAVSAALKRRAILHGTLTPILNTLMTLMLGLLLLLFTVSVTQDVWYIIFAALLAILPYAIGLLFCRWQRANPAALITNTVYVPIVIGFIVALPLLSPPEDLDSFADQWVIGAAIIGVFLLIDLVMGWRRPNGAAGIVLLGWFGVLAVVGRIVLTSNAITEDGVIFLWLIVFSLMISLFGFALLNVERARRWLWNPRYYF